MSCDEKYVCPLCGEEVKPSKEYGRDWMCIWCSNPNCLQPSTGWGTETMVVAKWKKYQSIERSVNKSVRKRSFVEPKVKI